jgi:lysophospholipase L1-like esterase
MSMLSAQTVLVVGVVGVASVYASLRGRRAVRPVRPTILLFGDSITQQSFQPGGWGARVADRFQRTADIVLRGYSGYNTRWALELVPAVFAPAASAPLLVTIMLGANDAVLPAGRGLSAADCRQHVPLDEYVANLRAIMGAVRAMGDGSARILLLTPPPCAVADWHQWCASRFGFAAEDKDPNRAFDVTARYAEAVVRLGAETATPVCDVHAAFLGRADWARLLVDGLHPNAAGGGAIAEAVIGAVRAHYPELEPETWDGPRAACLPLDFPDHKGIDVDDVAGSFRAHAEGKRPN